jgi:hypothetical protein
MTLGQLRRYALRQARALEREIAAVSSQPDAALVAEAATAARVLLLKQPR